MFNIECCKYIIWQHHRPNAQQQLLKIKLIQEFYTVFFLAAIDSQYKYDFLQLHVTWSHFLPISYKGNLNQPSHTLTLVSIKYKNLWNSLLKFKYYTCILHDWDTKNGHNKKLVVLCAIWHHLYNFKNVKNTHGGVLTLFFHVF